MPSLWINEIDYDQVGTDTASFIEIKGNGVSDLPPCRPGTGQRGLQHHCADVCGHLTGRRVVVGNDGMVGPDGTGFVGLYLS